MCGHDWCSMRISREISELPEDKERASGRRTAANRTATVISLPAPRRPRLSKRISKKARDTG